MKIKISFWVNLKSPDTPSNTLSSGTFSNLCPNSLVRIVGMCKKHNVLTCTCKIATVMTYNKYFQSDCTIAILS